MPPALACLLQAHRPARDLHLFGDMSGARAACEDPEACSRDSSCDGWGTRRGRVTRGPHDSLRRRNAGFERLARECSFGLLCEGQYMRRCQVNVRHSGDLAGVRWCVQPCLHSAYGLEGSTAVGAQQHECPQSTSECSCATQWLTWQTCWQLQSAAWTTQAVKITGATLQALASEVSAAAYTTPGALACSLAMSSTHAPTMAMEASAGFAVNRSPAADGASK